MESANPWGRRGRVRLEAPLPLDSGRVLERVEVAYETYGRPDPDRAVLVCHALSGDQHVASRHPVTGKPGWWARMVGEGRPLDPERQWIIATNVLGGCGGTTGPGSVDPATGERYGMRFPVITIGDMVRAQAAALDALGVGRLMAVVGGSMGGMQVLEWAARHPHRVGTAIAIGAAARHSAQNIAFHEIGRQAIMGDPRWRGGDYPPEDPPAAGLSVARMVAHVTYLSERGLAQRFDRRLQARERRSWSFDADFQVESYLRHQGRSFVARFDANAYLIITRAMDYFDLAEEHGGDLARAFEGTPTRFGLISFTSDWLYPPAETRRIADALERAGGKVRVREIDAPYGHDSFLLEVPALDAELEGLLRAAEGG